jgi:mRNA interferase RelE/StbE
VSFSVIYTDRALDQAAGFLKDDPEGLAEVFAAVDLLALDPYDPRTTHFGNPDVRRVQVGNYRILYDVRDDQVIVVVMHYDPQH